MLWLLACISAALLLFSGTALFWLSRQIDARRDTLFGALDPASAQLSRFQRSLMDEIATCRAYQVRPTVSRLAHVKGALERTHSLLAALGVAGSRLGPEFTRELATLRQRVTMWEAAPVAVMTGALSLDEFEKLLPHREGLANDVVAHLTQLDAAISKQSRQLVTELEGLERRRLLVLVVLFSVALVAVGMTAAFAKQAVISRQRALRAVADEALLRDAMASLTGAQVLPTALNRIVTIAMRLGEAEGAFIEHADSARNEVEIVAASGTSTPPVGIRVPYIESLTHDLVRASTRELTADLSAQAGHLRTTVDDEWESCYGIAVPLQHNGDVDGALVLVFKHGRVQPMPETVVRLWALGGWAGLALRRQQLSSELAAEHARLEAVVDEMPIGVVLADAPSGRVVKFNRHAVELWGSPQRVPQTIEDYAYWKINRSDGHPYQVRERPLARSILQGEIVKGEEAEIERRDGTRKTVLINSTPIRDAGGAIIAGVAAISDISEEKRREKAAHFLDEISRQLASTLDYDATMEAILQLMVPRVGDFASLFHRVGDVLIRKWSSSNVEPRVRQLFDQVDTLYPLPLPSPHPVAVAIRTGKPQLREVVHDDLLQSIARDERQLQWLRSLGIRSGMALPMIVRGKTIGALQIVSVTPTRRYTCEDLVFAEEIARRAALAVDNAQLFRIVNETGRAARFLADAVHTLSGSLEHEEVLRRATRLAVPVMADFTLACVQDERGVAHHIAWAHRDAAKEPMLEEAARLYQPDPRASNSAVVKALNSGQPVVIEEVTPQVLDQQGFVPRVRELIESLAPVSWMTVPLTARDRMLGAIVFASVDPERRYSSDDLSQPLLLASRTALAVQNAMLYRDARVAITTRDEILAIVSHDLRNPLNTIGLSAQSLIDMPLEPAAQRKHLELITRAKDRMDRLIQDLLDVTRVEAGQKLPLERRRENPSRFVREGCELFVTPMAEKGVRFECAIPEEVPDVFVDCDRIHQVLSNLIGNALKFTPAGGRIDVHVAVKDNTVVVSVQDTGPGIPTEDLVRVFHPFWQAPRAARHGAGLGLAISRGIIEQHGGRIWAESREGAGSTFFFTIPVASANELRAAD